MDAEPKSGRPKLDPADQRYRRLNIYLSDAEWDKLHEAAGLIPLRVWARNELIQAAQRLLRARKPGDG